MQVFNYFINFFHVKSHQSNIPSQQQTTSELQKTQFIIMALSSPLTVIGMINGMIGGFILILPVNALNAGWIFTLLVVLIIGAFSYYSCYLCVIHLGDQTDLDHAMFVHFNKSRVIKTIYDLTVFSNLLFLGFLYFQLICLQWDGIIGKQSLANPLANTLVLFLLIFLLKYFEFGASIMAYGIISIVGYVIFLAWVIASAPSGNNHWQPFGSGQVNLAAAMGGAYSIQTFFIPVLKRNLKPHKYVFFTLIAYIAGSATYFYIAFVGSIGILNRTSYMPVPQTIEQYFAPGKFQVTTIECLYLIHLYSVFPQFTLISKKRLFSIFKLKQTQKGKIPIPEIIYAAIFVTICLAIRLVKVKINQIVDLNGSVIGFFFIYFLPVILHIRCLYFSKNKISFDDKAALISQNRQSKQIVAERKTSLKVKMQMSEYRKSNEDNSLDITPTTLQKPLVYDNMGQQQQLPAFDRLNSKAESADETVKPFRFSEYEKQKKNIDLSRITQKQSVFEDQKDYFVCDCKKPTSKVLQVLELILLVSMIGLGAFILVNGLMTV